MQIEEMNYHTFRYEEHLRHVIKKSGEDKWEIIMEKKKKSLYRW